MKTFRYILAGVFSLMAIWLFATAPTELSDQERVAVSDRQLDVERMFNAVNSINDAARSIYTSRIVGPGLKSGLKFGEDWNEPDVEAGPLPALFLRLAAAKIEAKPPRLGLYLGSDAPINKSNLFSDDQAMAFEDVKASRAPVFSAAEGVGHIAMYPDVAGAAPCVSCHNDHADSPKTDWKLGDVMGATTWTYPADVLTPDEYLSTTDAFMISVSEAYSDYLAKVRNFDKKVEIGTEWPAPGKRVLPDLETFMAAVRAEAALTVMQELVLAHSDPMQEALE